MKITKLGHCCLVIEHKGIRIMIDPGAYTTAQNTMKDIDLILITHEHPDHLHVESIQTILKNSPAAQIITNTAVATILKQNNINETVITHNKSITFKDVLIEGYGEKHAIIYPSVMPVENTGYFIDNIFFYPGDAFYNPSKQVKILALPVSGTWMKLAEAIDYAKEVKPAHCFPVHDGMLTFLGSTYTLPEKELAKEGIQFTVIDVFEN